MNRWINMLAVLLALFVSEESNAAQITGRVKYTQNVTQGCNNGTRLKCNENGTNKFFGPSEISFLRTSDNTVTTGAVDPAGGYLVTFSQPGTYQMRVHFRDGTLSCTGDKGTATIALVGATDCTQVIANVGGPVVLATSTSVVTHDPIITAASGMTATRANIYMMMLLQRNVWRSEYNVTQLQGNKYKVRVKHVSSGAGCGAGCDSAGQNCHISCQMNTNTPSTVLFHETGHGIMQLVQNNALGTTTHASQTVQSCATVNAEPNQGRSWEEAVAEFVRILTLYTPGNVPAQFQGLDCGSSSCYSPLGNFPNPPACGQGAVTTSNINILRGLVDLADLNGVTNQVTCRNEQTVVPVSTMIAALTKFGNTGNTCNGFCVGTSEGGANEGCFCASTGQTVPSTPNWPYTGPNALPTIDQGGFMDYLGILKTQYGVSGSQLFDIWANTCWARGDSSVQLP